MEEITFSLNIRPRETTHFSAFELMHGSRKPRLPIQAENLSALYPDAGTALLDEWAGEDEVNKLVDSLHEVELQNQNIAGEYLAHSKTLMKKQHDKKLHPVTRNKFEKGDEVLIENVYRKKKGGKLEDRWLGPYNVDKVNTTNVRICRNKSIQRVKISKAKLWKKRPLVDSSSPTRKHLRLDSESEKEVNSESEGQLVSSPFTGREETVLDTSNLPKISKEEVLEVIVSLKDKIIDSIKSCTPLSKLHSELHSRSHLSFQEILDWRHDHYPLINSAIDETMDLDTTQQICDILTQFYLESYEVKIPEYQYTSQDFEFSTKWANESMNYSTKVLLPVIKEHLVKHFGHEIHPKSNSTLPFPFQTTRCPIEDMCLTWGGNCDGVELVNTCSVDNFFTLLSLYHEIISTAYALSGESPNATITNIFSMIDERKFDKVRLWIAPKLKISLIDCQYNFLGYEGKMVTLFQDYSLCPDVYKIVFQCWSCCCESEKRLNLTSVLTFIDNCQTSIEHQITQSYNCLKCRDPKANIERLSSGFLQILPLLILEVGHLKTCTIRECFIEDEIILPHRDVKLHYSLLGYTIHLGIHFYMKIKYNDLLYTYDGMEKPKLKISEKLTQVTSRGRINCIVYVLVSQTC